MANTITVKRSAVPSKAPATADLALGEIAINTFDGRMFFKKNNGADSIVEVYTGTGTGGTGPLVTVTSDTTLSNEDIILVDTTVQDININLAAVSGKVNTRYNIVNIGTHVVRILPQGTDKINGDSTLEIYDQWSSVVIVGTAARWVRCS
jgi:hypothetical protein